MKLSHPIAIRLASLVLGGVIRGYLGTLDIRAVLARDTDPLRTSGRIYLFWHEMILLAAYAYARLGLTTLISRHRDGELIAQVVAMLGGRAIRGSTSQGRDRGGAEALRRMMRPGRHRHLCITPDGPRGPRRVVNIGAVYLASRSGMALVPVGMAFDRPWRAGSWDRMALPRPFSRARAVTGSPIHVPDHLDVDQLDPWHRLVQDAMDRAQTRAEALAAAAACDLHAVTPRQMWDARRRRAGEL